jgi:DNA-binding GntR family transcriptional regulator
MQEKVRRKQLAYDYLLKEILENRLSAGMPIVEEDVVRKLDISRTPVREAIAVLETEGLVVCYPFRGTFVASLTPADVVEIFDLRALLERWALRKGFQKINLDELSKIERRFLELDQNSSWEIQRSADENLHNLIVRSADSTRVLAMLKQINTQVGYLRRIAVLGTIGSSRKPDSVKEHLDIIKYIKSGDEDSADAMLYMHLMSVKQVILDNMEISSIMKY